MNRQKKILVCPLDWGLGHATRCMPLIAYFIEKGCEVIIAGNEMTNRLIQAEFPVLQYIDLKGYNVRYSTSKFLLPFKILSQIPKILSVIQAEQEWLQAIIRQYEIDIVISDNRYGLYSNKVKSIFITHQLNIAVPQSGFLERILNKINHRFIRRFSAVWVPDYENNIMAGKLSVKSEKIGNVQYLGNLSRFKIRQHIQKKYDVIILLSGPEPQRTMLEKLILNQVAQCQLNILFIRGKPGSSAIPSDNKYISIVNHLSKEKLETALLQSEIIICRSGYSTVMDLIRLNKHAIFIPTPGQTEQEYLATYFAAKNWFTQCSQDFFNFQDEIKEFKKIKFSDFPDLNMEQYKTIVNELLMG